MIIDFGHHFIPLLPQDEAASNMESQTYLTSVNAACEKVSQINRVLKMIGRYEIGVLPDTPDFFGNSKISAHARNNIWKTIKDSTHIQWIILTKNPDNIKQSLPPTWIGNGFKNVCIGLSIDEQNAPKESIQKLRDAPLQNRMIHVTSSARSFDFTDQLKDIDWVVYTGTQETNDSTHAEHLRSLCRDSNTAFLFHQPGKSSSLSDTTESIDNISAPPIHPFGKKINLAQPTTTDLKKISDSLNHHPKLPLTQKSTISPAKTTNNVPSPEQTNTTLTTTIAPVEVIPYSSIPPKIKADENSRDKFNSLDEIVRKGLKTFVEVGNALKEIREQELWQLDGHSSWDAYCKNIGGLTKTHSNRLIIASEVAINLQQAAPIGVTPRSESQIRPLCKLKSPDKQAKAWARAVEEAGGKQPTAKQITAITNEMLKGENAKSKSKSKPNRKAKLTSIFHRLHEAILNNRPKGELIAYIKDLGKTLKIEDESSSEAKT